jgi:hypothetical protein
MRIIQFLFIMALLTMFTQAESPSCCREKEKHGKTSTVYKAMHYFFSGGSFVDNRDVSTKMEDLGYPGFSRYNLLLGGGGFRCHGRLVEGGDVEALLWRRNTSGNKESRFGAGRAVSYLGVSLLNKPHLAVFPLVGLGAGISSLRAGPIEVPFDSGFSVPSQTPPKGFMYQGSFLVDLGIGAFFSRPSHGGKHRKLTLGLRSGYMFDPVETHKWFRDGISLKGGPDSNLSGPYLRLTIGISKLNSDRCENKKCHHNKNWNKHKCKKECRQKGKPL